MESLLGIYLKDQLAMGVLWRELARRAQGHNRGTDLGDALDRVALGIAQDVDTFESVMRELGIRPDPVKTTFATVAERFGRLKLNGRIGSYSPLSRFEELEFLTMGIDGKKQMWVTLRDLAALGSRLPEVDFDGLIARAEGQRAELEPYRVRSGQEAFREDVG
jgi:hypothetical protein